MGSRDVKLLPVSAGIFPTKPLDLTPRFDELFRNVSELVCHVRNADRDHDYCPRVKMNRSI
jgi:hypothetical protein